MSGFKDERTHGHTIACSSCAIAAALLLVFAMFWVAARAALRLVVFKPFEGLRIGTTC